MKKEIICTVCPIGCHILAEGTKEEITSIEGYTCNRGKEYGEDPYQYRESGWGGPSGTGQVRQAHSQGIVNGLHGSDTQDRG